MSNVEPTYVRAKDQLVNVVIDLAFKVKHVSYAKSTANQGLESREPHVQVADGEIIGLIAILDYIEASSESHSLFPNGNKGMPIALKYWSEKFLSDGLIEGVDVADSSPKIKEHLLLIDRQLDGERHFLQGSEAGLADIFAFAPIYILFAERAKPMAKALSEFSTLLTWCERMKKIKS